MKMSDYFALPVFANNHEVGSRCSLFEGKGVTVASSFYANQKEAYDAIANAINNHDQLVESLREVIDLSKSPREHKEARERASKLLAELGGDSR